jgi:hypothetical protein
MLQDLHNEKWNMLGIYELYNLNILGIIFRVVKLEAVMGKAA